MSNFNKYLEMVEDNSSKKEEIQAKIAEFFSNNSSIDDKKDIHSLAKSLNIDKHKFEEIIYDIIVSFFNAGRSKDFKGEFNPEELKKGIEIEMEHTTNKLIAEKIAKDHLAEISDYYTRLTQMEKEANE